MDLLNKLQSFSECNRITPYWTATFSVRI